MLLDSSKCMSLFGIYRQTKQTPRRLKPEINANAPLKLNLSAIYVQIGTPMIFAIVNPPVMIDIARHLLSFGQISKAITDDKPEKDA